MGGIVSLIKNLFGGLMSFVTSLLGGKQDREVPQLEATPKTRKSSGYFLELDEAQSISRSEKETAKTAETAIAPKVTPERAIAAQPVMQSAAQEAEPTKAEVKAVKTRKAKLETPEEAVPANAPKPVAVASALNIPQPTVTFAPDYLLPKADTNGRRRPGANMNYFLDMARQVKPSN